MYRRLGRTILALVVAGATTIGWAQESGKQPPRQTTPTHQQHKHQQQQQGDAEMQAWIEAATPGPQHRLMNYCIGEWQATWKHWFAPGQEAPPEQGICVNEWVLGGRFIKTTFRGTFMGMPYEGVGYTGFDKVTGKFVSTWMDNMSTSIMYEMGSYDPDKKLFTYTSEMQQPTGVIAQQTTTVQIINDNQHVMTFYQKLPGMEQPKKVMEVTFNRLKKAKPPTTRTKSPD